MQIQGGKRYPFITAGDRTWFSPPERRWETVLAGVYSSATETGMPSGSA